MVTTPAQEQATLALTHPQPRQITPLEMMSQVLQTQNPKDAVEVVKELAKLQMEMRKQDAEEDFNVSMSLCQVDIKAVIKDATATQNGKTWDWATFQALDDHVRPIYSKHKFSVSWDTGKSDIPDQMVVFAYVSKGLHTRTYQIPMDISGKGAKGGDVMDKPKAIGSGLSYAKRYLLSAIWNIPLAEDAPGIINNGWLKERLEWIANCRNEPELTKIFNQAFGDAKKERAAQAMLLLVEARDKQKKEIS